jgi:hypothetical protein
MKPNHFIQYCPDNSPLGNSKLPYFLLEGQFIELLQDRRFSLSQRLVRLGHILRHLITENVAQDSKEITQGFKSILSDNFSREPNMKWYLHNLFLMSNIFLTRFASSPVAPLLRRVLLTLSSAEPQPCHNSVHGLAAADVAPPSPDEYQRQLARYYMPARCSVEPIIENFMVNYILSKHFYMKPLHLAFYRMAFLYAAITAFAIGYSMLENGPVTQDTILQAIYDTAYIFSGTWFYPFASLIQAGTSYLRVVEKGIALASI